MKKYSVGIDFGTLSARCVLMDLGIGKVAVSSEMEYRHRVMDRKLPCGKKLMPDWALHHPEDYLDVMRALFREVIAKADIPVEQIVGVGVDSTASTVFAIKKDGMPLCFLDAFKSTPHAYALLWKHHAASKEAEKMEKIAAERNEPFLRRYGGKISSEWTLPKIWQILNEAPQVYEEADYFIDTGDWITFLLTGNLVRSNSCAGFKVCWSEEEGYPSKKYFAALDPRLEDVVSEKLNVPIMKIGTKMGAVDKKGAELTGLKEGTAVAVSNMDAHVACVGVGVTKPGKLMAIIGTSACYIILADSYKEVKGICGIVKDGVIPGYYGYEAGQSCVGDQYQWLVENYVSNSYMEKSKELGMDIHNYLSMLAGKKLPGSSGLLALDWWNGNRSFLVDFDLSGTVIGYTLKTQPEDLYCALVESTAFGARNILETYEANGLKVEEMIACGGIAIKSPFAMQVFSNIIKKKITVLGSAQSAAVSSAIFGAVAAGKHAGGFDDLEEAVNKIVHYNETVYTPDENCVEIYDILYTEYMRLHNYFSRENHVMKKLKILAQNGKRQAT